MFIVLSCTIDTERQWYDTIQIRSISKRNSIFFFQCKFDFCWVCLESWKKHSSATGGYFRCNRFDAQSKADEKLGVMLSEVSVILQLLPLLLLLLLPLLLLFVTATVAASTLLCFFTLPFISFLSLILLFFPMIYLLTSNFTYTVEFQS